MFRLTCLAPLLGLSASVALLAASGSAAPKQARPPHQYRYGDTLPPGARLRPGTSSGGLSYANIALSSDGRLLAWVHPSMVGGWISVWDLIVNKERRTVKYPGVSCLAFSADGSALASASRDSTLTLWDLATGRPLFSYGTPINPVPGRWNWLDFSPDGKTLASLWVEGKPYADDRIYLWEAASGKRRGHLQARKKEGATISPVLRSFVFSPDGRTVAGTTVLVNSRIYLWDLATGQVLHQLDYWATALAFSPDGRILAAVGGDHEKTIRLWEVATGKPLRDIRADTMQRGLAFSPDGRLLASGGAEGDLRSVNVWDATTGRRLHAFSRHDEQVQSVAFTPDGKTLISGSGASVLLWDLTAVPALKALKPQKAADPKKPAPAPPPKPLPREAVDSLWADLASDDADKAYRAVWQVALHPGQALPLLKTHLRPVIAPDPRKLAQLIADLDSSDFKVRRRAVAELDQVADTVLPALRKARDKTDSKEVQKRLTELLKAQEPPITSGAKLRPLRAVEALEHVGTPEARKLLKGLAGGAPEARLTQDAKLALQRLARRPVARR